jgi:hypothetical protein
MGRNQNMTDNVIQFKPRNEGAANTNAVLDDQFNYNVDYLDDMSDQVTFTLDDLLEEYLDIVRDKEYYKDIHMIGECIRSLLYRQNKIPHPLQTYVDESISVTIKDGKALAEWFDTSNFDNER